MTGWHVHTDPFLFTLGDTHEHIGQDSVVLPYLIILLHVTTEGNQVLSAGFCLFPPGQLIHHQLKLLGLGIRKLVNVLEQVLQLCVSQAG
jgi:hypothetical protein